MHDIDIATLRPVIVMVPALGTAGLWLAVGAARRRGAAVLALLWNAIGLTAVNVLSIGVGWWRFDAAGPAFLGIPVDLLVAWTLLWSTIPVLAARWIPLPYLVGGLVLLDVYVMPASSPLVQLGADWWYGELLAVATCLVPAVTLAALTVSRRALRWRVGLQVILFTAVLFVATPVLTYEMSSRSSVLRPPPDWRPHFGGIVDMVTIQFVGVVAAIGLTAVIDFARAGGTPWPWDPPTRLVTRGPYAYVANPMQLCGTVLVLLVGVMLSLPMMAVTALVAAAFSAGLATFVEDDALTLRFGRQWSDYRSAVRNWLPRWRPASSTAPAQIYLARGCDPCSDLAGWVAERSPIGLEVLAAQDYPAPLRRARYVDDAHAVSVDGVRAVAAVFGHLNLAWAMCGWVIGTPGISHGLQLLVDACGGAPRDVAAS